MSHMGETDNVTNQPGRKAGRTARPGSPTHSGRVLHLKKSTRLAIYLYISSHYELHESQRAFVAHFQAKLNLAEIQSALKFAHTLTTNSGIRARMHVGESESEVKNLKQVPFYGARPKNLREQRRIGVGYRDKGSLPKPSRPDWDKENIRAVSLPDETVPLELQHLLDLSRDSSEEAAEVLSVLRKTYPEAESFLMNPLSIREFTKLDSNFPFPEKEIRLQKDFSDTIASIVESFAPKSSE